MNIKNPYKLINKANSTFNLYLKKYEEYEKFMETYGEDQEKTNKTIQLFLEKYRYEYDQLNNTINKILNLLDAINEENNANKKRINNLEMEIHSLNVQYVIHCAAVPVWQKLLLLFCHPGFCQDNTSLPSS